VYPCQSEKKVEKEGIDSQEIKTRINLKRDPIVIMRRDQKRTRSVVSNHKGVDRI
jgi:hypothetical protein